MPKTRKLALRTALSLALGGLLTAFVVTAPSPSTHPPLSLAGTGWSSGPHVAPSPGHIYYD